jgi:hypothetical protein
LYRDVSLEDLRISRLPHMIELKVESSIRETATAPVIHHSLLADDLTHFTWHYHGSGDRPLDERKMLSEIQDALPFPVA